LSTVVGGALGKLAVRYGAPWKWKKFANLATRTKGLLGDLVDGVKNFFKASKCHSFAPGTLVLMADGTKKPISKIKPGEKVLATDPASGKTKAQAVVATHINLDVDLTDLGIDVAGEQVLVETTAHHPFWSRDRSAWINAADLKAGERLLTTGGRATGVAVAAARSYTRPAVMHDLTVDTIHAYYVLAGASPVLVHNCNDVRVSSAASDWVEKGAHVHVGGKEVRIFPTHDGKVGGAPVEGLRSGRASAAQVERAVECVTTCSRVRNDMIAKATSARDSMNSGEWGAAQNKAVEMHFLIRHLEKMG
jgi:hypothetical protein